jgi:hypothetical protein
MAAGDETAVGELTGAAFNVGGLEGEGWIDKYCNSSSLTAGFDICRFNKT